MQKKIIVLAIAAAMTGPALAYADATVYGQANLSIDMVNDGAVGTSLTTNQLVSNNSRVGVKGSEDLGDGMSVVWQMEGSVGMDTGSTTVSQLFDRNTYLGLKSDSMGTLVLGRHDTPYKTSTRRLDVFEDTVAADNRTLIGGHDIRASNVIAYMSPSMGGMSVGVASVFGAETATGGTGNDKKGSLLSLAGMYEAGPIYATLALQTMKAGNVNTGDLEGGGAGPLFGAGSAVDDESKAYKLGGSYSMDAFTVNAVIQKSTDKDASVAQETTWTNLYLAGKFAVSDTDAVKLAYTKHGESETAGTKNKDDASQVAIGYDHGMSKNTTVYALYTKVSDNTKNGLGADIGPDPSTVSVGIKHSF